MSSAMLKRLAAALGVVIVIWGALAFVRRPPNDRTISLALAKVDPASVDSVVVTKAGDTAIVARAGATRWTTNGFPADSGAVASFLAGLADSTPMTELVAENRTSHARLGVTPDSALHMVIFTHGGAKPLDLMAGGRTPDYGGVYVRRSSDDAVYAMHGGLVDGLERTLDDWRDKRIVAVVPDSVATMDIDHAGKRYTLTRDGKAWKLSSGKVADSSAVSSWLEGFKDLRASGFAKRAQADSLDFAKAKSRALLKSKSGAVLADVTLDSTSAGQWAHSASSKAVYRLDAWNWDRIAPAESTFVAKKKT